MKPRHYFRQYYNECEVNVNQNLCYQWQMATQTNKANYSCLAWLYLAWTDTFLTNKFKFLSVLWSNNYYECLLFQQKMYASCRFLEISSEALEYNALDGGLAPGFTWEVCY